MANVASTGMLQLLKEVSNVVHQLIPEKYRFSENNKGGMYPSQVAIPCGQQGKFFFVDLNARKSTTRLVETDLHNPIRLNFIKVEIPQARSLCYLEGKGTVKICCHEANILQVVDLGGRVTLKASRLKDRTSLVTELERREQSCDGTVKDLKQKLEACWQEEHRNYQSQGRKFDVLHLDQDSKPSVICVLSDQLLGCSYKVSREAYCIVVQSNDYILCGTVNKLCDYLPICEQVFIQRWIPCIGTKKWNLQIENVH